MFEHLALGCMCSGKRCTRCVVVQCLEGFHRYRRSSDGRRSECKVCRKAERETEEFKAKRRQHHKEHAEQINKQKREWAHAHPEQVSETAKRSRQRHPGRVKNYACEYNRSERGKERDRKYREHNPEKVRQFSRKWKEAHPEMEQEHAKVRAANYKAKKLGIPGKITVQQWRELKAFYNNICLRCGEQEPTITLTIDHIIPFALRGINDISNVQPLCEFCNTSKGIKIVDYRRRGNQNDKPA